jgi:hypothetical protein
MKGQGTGRTCTRVHLLTEHRPNPAVTAPATCIRDLNLINARDSVRCHSLITAPHPIPLASPAPRPLLLPSPFAHPSFFPFTN